MFNLEQLEVQYITNKDGEKTAVILSIDSFQEILEDLEDLAVIAERRNELTVSHKDVLVELKQDDLLHN